MLLKALQKTQEDDAARRSVSLVEGQIIKGVAVDIEFLEIGLEEINMQIVQSIEISIEKFGGNLIVELLP